MTTAPVSTVLTRLTRAIDTTASLEVRHFFSGVSQFRELEKTSLKDLICFRVLDGYPSVHGAVFTNQKSYGPVRCGFTNAEILRCGSVRF